MSEKSTTDGTEEFVITSTDAPVATEVKEVEAPPTESTETVPEEKEAVQETVAEEESEIVNGDDTTAEPSESKKRSGVQKRIDQLTREREDARRKNEDLQKQLDERNTKEVKAPKEDDFDDYESYLDAKDKHEEQAKAKPIESKADDMTNEHKTAQAIIEERYLAAENKPKDFDEVAFSDEVNQTITPAMVEAMAECENTTDIMYQLGKNIELAKTIAGKSPTQQMIAIAKLDNKKASPTKPVKTSKAAQPISPVKGSDTPTKKSLGAQSFSEYENTRNKQEGKKRHW